MILGSYSKLGDTERGVKWFTDEHLDRADGVDFSTAVCPLVRDEQPIPCLIMGFFTGHGPYCFAGVRITMGERTWTLTGEWETGETFIGFEGVDDEKR